MHEEEPIVKILTRDELSPNQKNDVEEYEVRYKLQFDRFAAFSQERFNQLHNFQGVASDYEEIILSETSKLKTEVMDHFKILTEVANLDENTKGERIRYRKALLEIYGMMMTSNNDPRSLISDDQTLLVAPEREGAILARKMKWTPDGRSFFPDAKRIADGDGVLVGLRGLALEGREFQRAVLVDGAIASGATLLAIMKSLRGTIGEFHIYCIHSTREALNAIKAYSARHGLRIRVVAGHVTSGMNRYYAVQYDEATGRNLFVVGDLGDTIADLDD